MVVVYKSISKLRPDKYNTNCIYHVFHLKSWVYSVKVRFYTENKCALLIAAKSKSVE